MMRNRQAVPVVVVALIVAVVVVDSVCIGYIDVFAAITVSYLIFDYAIGSV
jgi:hypothetical protein